MGFDENFCHAWQATVMADAAEIQNRKKLADMVGISEEVQRKMGAEFSQGTDHHPIMRVKKSAQKPDTYYIILRKEPYYRHVVEFKLDGTPITNKRTDGQEAETVCSYDDATATWTSTLKYIGLDTPPFVSVRKLVGDKVDVVDTCGDVKVTQTLGKVEPIASAEDDAL